MSGLTTGERPVTRPAGSPGPPRLWQEILLLGLGFGAYTVIQKNVPIHHGAPIRHGQDLLDLDRRLHLDIAAPLNRTLAGTRWLAVPANYYYVVLHFMVPILVLLYLIFRRPDRYRVERRIFVIATLIALAVFWFYPTAPPRLLTYSGFTDTLSKFHTIGSYHSGPEQQAADEYASMPSLHFAWALWCATTMWRLGGRSLIRILWFVYPLCTAVDVLATGNHYVVDIIAGGALLALGYLGNIGYSTALSRRSQSANSPSRPAE